MIQEDSQGKRVNWRLVIVAALVIGAMLLTSGGVLAFTGGWNAWFDRGPAAGEQLIRPASGEESLPAGPELNDGSPFNSGSPSGGGSDCEHENPNALPQGLD